MNSIPSSGVTGRQHSLAEGLIEVLQVIGFGIEVQGIMRLSVIPVFFSLSGTLKCGQGYAI